MLIIDSGRVTKSSKWANDSIETVISLVVPFDLLHSFGGHFKLTLRGQPYGRTKRDYWSECNDTARLGVRSLFGIAVL